MLPKNLEISTSPTKVAQNVLNPSFDNLWKNQKRSLRMIEDGITLTIDYEDTNAKTKIFMFNLSLPDYKEHVFQVVKDSWTYDIEYESQCRAYKVPKDASSFLKSKENEVWLHWDEKEKKLVVNPNRNWIDGNDGSLNNRHKTLFSSSILTIIIGLLAQDGDAVYFAPSILRRFINKGIITSEIVLKAVKILLNNPVISPGKLTRPLEDDIKLLPILWPILTESIKLGGVMVSEGQSLQAWLSRVLNLTIRYLPYLLEGNKRGEIDFSQDEWDALYQISSSKKKSTAVEKAKLLLCEIEEFNNIK